MCGSGVCYFANKRKMGINYLVAQGPEFYHSSLFGVPCIVLGISGDLSGAD